MGKIQSREFDLLRTVDPKLDQKPVVKRTIIFKFKRAKRMRDPLDGIRNAMGEIIHRINAPFIADMWVRGA